MRTALLLLTAACASESKTPLSVEELGPLRFVEAIRGRDGGYSAGWDGRSVWD